MLLVLVWHRRIEWTRHAARGTRHTCRCQHQAVIRLVQEASHAAVAAPHLVDVHPPWCARVRLCAGVMRARVDPPWCACVHARMRARVCACAYARACAFVWGRARACVCVCVCVCVRACVRVRVCMSECVRARTAICLYSVSATSPTPTIRTFVSKVWHEYSEGVGADTDHDRLRSQHITSRSKQDQTEIRTRNTA